MEIEHRKTALGCRSGRGKTGCRFSRDQGAVLVVTLVLVLVLLVLGSAVTNIVFCEKMMASYHLASQQALMLADSGIERARAGLARDVSAILTEHSFGMQLGQGTVSVVITAPNGNGMIEARSQAVLNNGAKKTMTAEFGISPYVGLSAKRVAVSGSGLCTVQGNAAVQQAEGMYQQVGNRYTGFAVLHIDINTFKQLAQMCPDEWQVYSGPKVLTADDFAFCSNVLVNGDVILDNSIRACPEGSLLVSTGSVTVCPAQEEGNSTFGLSIICARDLSISANQDAVLIPSGYLHSNTKIAFDVGTAEGPLTFDGVIAADEVTVNTNGEFVIREERSVLLANEVLKDTVLGSMVSYQEVAV